MDKISHYRRQPGVIPRHSGNLASRETVWWGREKCDTAFMSKIYLSGEGELGALNVKANIQGAPHRGSDSQSTEKLAVRDHVKMLLLVGNARVLFSGISIAADRSGREDSNLCQVIDLLRGDSDNSTRKQAIAG